MVNKDECINLFYEVKFNDDDDDDDVFVYCIFMSICGQWF